VPNCPVCHQTMALLARQLEAGGIATVIIGAAKDIVEHVGVPRLLFSDVPLGNAAGLPHDAASQDVTLELALRLLEAAPAARTTVQNPLRWPGDACWRDDYLNVANLTPDGIERERAEFMQQGAIARALRCTERPD
jgi:D-proline reductase (dithiol) PrdB